MAAGAQTGSEYIKHHLTNLTFGKDPTDGVWKFAHTAQEAQDMGFYAIHVDSMGWAIGLGIIFIMLFSMVARKARVVRRARRPPLPREKPPLGPDWI